jgi:hypothetical protein
LSSRTPDPQPREPSYSHGLPDHHDPLAGVGGAPPARSALTLRLVLATFGLIICAAAAIVFCVLGVIVLGVILACAALVAVVDIAVVVRRKRRGEPG